MALIAHARADSGANRERPLVAQALPAVAVLSAFVTLWLAAMSPHVAPPGSDAGNWLAFGRQLFGENVKAARAAYPPLLPALYWAMSRGVGPLLAAKLIAVSSSALGGVPVYLIGASFAPRSLALLGMIMFVGTGYHSEVIAFGGYPQTLAEAMALMALWLFTRGARHRQRKSLIGGALLGSLVIGTHHLTAVTLIVGIGVISVALIFQGHRAREVFATMAGFALLMGLFSLPYVPAYLTMIRELAGSPMNAQRWALSTTGETFGYIFRNTVGIWYALMSVTILGILLPGRREWRDARTLVGAAFVTPLILFGIFAEVRFLQFLFASLALGLVLTGAALGELTSDRATRVATVTLLALAVAGTTWGGVQFTRQAFPWYQIIDQPHLDALDWLRLKTPPEALVAATATKNGLILGWWIEGYAGRRTLIGGDPKWMSFREEKMQTQTANAIFDALRSNDQGVRALMEREHVSYLFIDKQDGAAAAAASLFPRAFENEAVLIVTIGRRT